VTQSLYRLVYYSRNHIADDGGALAANVADILARSRVNNARDGITGALLFNANCFAQVLEGTLPKIEAAFERIQQDERHGDVSLLVMEPIVARTFPDWSMGFVGLSPEHANRFNDVAADSGFDISRLSGDEIHTLLQELALQEESAAA
jgi:hypothetical protein